MALLADASTPNAVTVSLTYGSGAGPQNVTTAAFTPPVGAVLVVVFCTNSGTSSNTLSNITVTDNRASHLTYTLLLRTGNLSNDNQTTVWYSSAVPAATSMTVTASFTDAAAFSNNPALLRVIAFSGADSSTAIGASGGARGLTTNVNSSYVSTRSGSLGYLGYADWAQKGIPTVPGSESVDASYDVAGSNTYAVIKQAANTISSGTTVTMSTATPNSAAQISYVYFEVIPALVGPTAGSVPSGTGHDGGRSIRQVFIFRHWRLLAGPLTPSRT
jgi:hypothetical protein